MNGNNEMNMELPEKQIDAIENSEWIKTGPKDFNDYFVKDQVNDMLTFTIHYCNDINSASRKFNEAVKFEQSVKWKKMKCFN